MWVSNEYCTTIGTMPQWIIYKSESIHRRTAYSTGANVFIWFKHSLFPKKMDLARLRCDISAILSKSPILNVFIWQPLTENPQDKATKIMQDTIVRYVPFPVQIGTCILIWKGVDYSEAMVKELPSSYLWI